jgi:hypothetical protein
MANFNADNAAALASTPPTRVKVNKQHGRIRFFESTYTAPATGTPQIADKIVWGKLPLGARVVGPLSSLGYAVGTASSTLNVGDAASAARHLAATSVATAGNTALANPANGAASFETSDASGGATDNCTLVSTVAGAAIAANQVITLRVAYVLD